jgi:hypothetical protein
MAPDQRAEGDQQQTPPQGRQHRQLLHQQDATEEGERGEVDGQSPSVQEFLLGRSD